MNAELVNEDVLRRIAKQIADQLHSTVEESLKETPPQWLKAWLVLSAKLAASAALDAIGAVEVVETEAGELRLGCEPGICLGNIAPGNVVLVRAKKKPKLKKLKKPSPPSGRWVKEGQWFPGKGEEIVDEPRNAKDAKCE